jgi:aromatic-L-amino-acid decarboxylase
MRRSAAPRRWPRRQLGRRFRALKLWMLIRYFGADGMADRIREHCRLARELAAWVAADPDWELLAPVPFATLCLRHRPAALAGRVEEPAVISELNARNEAILEGVNRSGRIFLSHTSLRGRYAIRVSIGNPRTTIDHVRLCWDLLRRAATGKLHS